MLAMLLPCVGAWAQTPVLTYENIEAPQELSAADAQTIREMSGMTIVADVEITNSSNWSLLFAAVADYTSNSTSNNSIWGVGVGGNSMRYYVGARNGGWYSSNNGDVTTSSKKLVVTYNGTAIKNYVDGRNVNSVNSTKALNSFADANAKFFLGGVVYNTNTSWGVFDGTISSIKIYNTVLTDNQIAAMSYPANAIIDYTQFVSGNVYTFQTERGWLMAKEGTDFVYSSGKLNDAEPAEDNKNCQWVYYATEKGKYLYNVAVGKFICYNSANLNSIPLSESPNTSNIGLKNSTAAGRPILLGLENKVINHNLTNGAYVYGALLWGDGWTGYLNDPGSATLALNQGEASTEILNAIKVEVDAFEADNTTAVAALDEAIANAQNWFTQYVGTGVGKYSPTDNEYMSKFESIVAFREAIQATNDPQPAVVEAKTAELQALIATFQLNMPESGKFYRINNGGNYITSNVTAGGRIALSTTSDATSIYYFDGTHLLAYSTGLYIGLNKTDWTFEAIGSADISTIEFIAAANGATAKYNVKSGGRWLHKDNGFVNRCSSNTCGDAHNWSIEEVTELPVVISEAAHATFYAPVAVQVSGATAYTVAVNGDWATLTEVEDGVIPANTGVVLKGDAGTYNFAITTIATTLETALRGTAATTMVAESAYVLSAPEGVVGLYLANANPFQNNAFKAYLPATAVTSNAQALRFTFGGTTAIESVINNDANAPIYDLSGRRVMNAVKGGIYIQNGKKFIVK